MVEEASGAVRVCLTRCPLPPAEERVHSLPCHIHFDGPAAVKTFFRPQCGDGNSNSTDHGTGSEEQDVKTEKKSDKDQDDMLRAEFRGIQLQGQKLPLAPLGFTGLVLEDSGLRHTDDEGRIWEVEDHFNELVWWDVPNNTTSEGRSSFHWCCSNGVTCLVRYVADLPASRSVRVQRVKRKLRRSTKLFI